MTPTSRRPKVSTAQRLKIRIRLLELEIVLLKLDQQLSRLERAARPLGWNLKDPVIP